MARALPAVRRRKDVYAVDRPGKGVGALGSDALVVGRRGSASAAASSDSASRLPRRHTMEPQTTGDPLKLDMAPSAAALAPSSVLGQGRAFFLQGLRSGSKSQHDIESEQEAKCCQLALRYRLSLSEAKRILREFIKAKKNQDGGLDRKEFDQVMCNIFDVDSVDDHIAKGAYEAACVSKVLDIEPFFNWYVQNMFTNVNTLNCSKDKVESEKLIYDIAKKHNVSTMTVDKVKVKFDYYDTDKSGHIDFEEFEKMFCAILKTKSRDDLNPERLKRFWKEIDINGDEGVDFEEFAIWYLKYFNADSDENDFDMAGPLRAYYDSYDPRVQRRNSMHGSMASIE